MKHLKKNEASKFKFLLMFILVFCSFARIFADDNDCYVSVTQSFRYTDGSYDCIDSPQISIKEAYDASGEEGSCFFLKYDFRVLKKTLWWRSSGEKVRVAIVIPKNFYMYPVSMSGCGLIAGDKGNDEGLPTYYKYDNNGNCCYWFTFSSGSNTTASIEFLGFIDDFNSGSKIPIKVKFWHLDNIDFKNPSDEPLMKSTNRTFNIFTKR